jgi:hypothetical protein
LRPVQIYIGEWLDAFLKDTWRFVFSRYVYVGLFELAIIAAVVPLSMLLQPSWQKIVL